MLRLVIALSIILITPKLWACSFAPLTTEFVVGSNENLTPEMPQFEVSELRRGTDGQTETNGQLNSCNDLGILVLVNRAPYSKTTGYKFRIIEGEFEGQLFPKHPLISLNYTEHPSRYNFIWIDGNTYNQEPIDILVEIVGVSKSGAESEHQLLRVLHSGTKNKWWEIWK